MFNEHRVIISFYSGSSDRMIIESLKRFNQIQFASVQPSFRVFHDNPAREGKKTNNATLIYICTNNGINPFVQHQ